MQTNAQETVKGLISLLKIEKDADYLQYQQKITLQSIDARIKTGVTIYPVNLLNHFISTGERITLKIERPEDPVDNSNFQVGTIVGVFKPEGDKEFHVSGVISYITRKEIRVVLHKNNLPDWLDTGRIGINLLFDETTYVEMEKALNTVMEAENNRLAELREICYGNRTARYRNGYDLSIPALNESQNAALTQTINAIDLSIIHGPPGTGKTTTLIHCIKSIVAEEKQVLVCAPSNAAVDLLVEKLIHLEINVIRIGHPARLDDNVIENSLDVRISKHNQYKELRKARRKSEELRSIAYQYKRNFGKTERKQRELLIKESKMLKSYSRDIENYIIDDLLENTQVIACTITGANQSFIKDRMFKTVFIDECGQAMEPACWIPIIKANRVIMAGDHFQLPPTVKSYEAAKGGLEISLFEKAAENTNASQMLTIQYRMAEVIKGFSSEYFYSGKLKTADEVLRRTQQGKFEFIDTAGCGFTDKTDPTSLSTYNPDEALLLVNHLKANLPDANQSIGIITPYKAQISVLKELINLNPEFESYVDKIKISTVDGFQGQERDVIYISLVRSNDKGEIGFLKEYRRINVAITRARNTLVILGDSATLGNDSFYNQMLSYIEKNGIYKSAFEYLYQ